MQNRKLSEVKTNPSSQPRRCCFERTDGTQCKAHPQTGRQYCFFHDPAVREKRAAANKAGGIASRSKPPIPSKPLKTVSDVAELMSESIHQLRRGQIDPESCATIGLLSRVLLNALEKDALEKSSHAHWQAVVSHQDPLPVPVPHSLLLPDAEYAAEYAAADELPEVEIPDVQIDDEVIDKKT